MRDCVKELIIKETEREMRMDVGSDGKAAGPDDITVEMFGYEGRLTRLFSTVLENQMMPEEQRGSVLVQVMCRDVVDVVDNWSERVALCLCGSRESI